MLEEQWVRLENLFNLMMKNMVMVTCKDQIVFPRVAVDEAWDRK